MIRVNFMKEPLVSVVIVNWNGMKFLKNCLDSLQKQSYRNFEVIMVDNNSLDESVDFVKKKYKHVKIIQLGKNFRFAKPNNIGFDEAMKNKSLKYIAILNNDTIVDKNWITEMVKIAESDDKIGSCAPQVLMFNEKVDSAGMLFYKNCMPGARGKLAERDYLNNIENVFGAPGSAALYRKEMLLDTKLDDDYFDSDYEFYQEEFDLSWRAQLMGWKCVYVPKSIVYHIGTGTGRIIPNTIKYHLERNRLWTIRKNLHGELLLYCLPHIILYEIMSVPFYIFKKQFFIILKARVDGLRNSAAIGKKRRIIQKKAVAKPNEIRKWMLNRNYLEDFIKNIF